MLRTLSAIVYCLPVLALAQSVELSFVDAKGNAGPAGNIVIEDTPYGALLTPNLEKLPPGLHGFHVHEKPSCAPSIGANGAATPAGAAGGHWDPDKTGVHAGPYGQGHKGDLPALYVGADGKANYPVLAPRLKAADFSGHALMVHAGGDNHSDHPQPLGGGGARMACGVVK